MSTATNPNELIIENSVEILIDYRRTFTLFAPFHHLALLVNKDEKLGEIKNKKRVKEPFARSMAVAQGDKL